MVVEFSIIPIGGSVSISKYVAKAVKIVADSGLSYKVTAMGTIVEGDWNEVMNLIKKCHETVLEESERVITRISIDDRKSNLKNRMEQKIMSLEKELKMKLNT